MIEADSKEEDDKIQVIVEQFKSRGLFDEFRHEALNELDTKPFFYNLKHHVEESVSKFLSNIRWSYSLNKNDLRSKLRTEVLQSKILNDSVNFVVNHTINIDMQSRLSLNILKFLEKFFINEHHISDKEFYLNPVTNTLSTSVNEPKEITSMDSSLPPLPPLPPKEFVPPPPLPPQPSYDDNYLMNTNKSPFDSFISESNNIANDITILNNSTDNSALAALDKIKNKLAQLLNSGELDLNNINLDMGSLNDQMSLLLGDMNVDQSEKVVIPDRDSFIKSNSLVNENEDQNTRKKDVKDKDIKISGNENTKLRVHTKHEVVVEDLDELLNDGIKKLTSTIKIDNEDISVSSVHTSDLSSLEDQISISSSELPEIMDEHDAGSTFPISDKDKGTIQSDFHSEDQKFDNTSIINHAYHYLLGGCYCSEDNNCFNYYQNIISLNNDPNLESPFSGAIRIKNAFVRDKHSTIQDIHNIYGITDMDRQMDKKIWPEKRTYYKKIKEREDNNSSSPYSPIIRRHNISVMPRTNSPCFKYNRYEKPVQLGTTKTTKFSNIDTFTYDFYECGIKPATSSSLKKKARTYAPKLIAGPGDEGNTKPAVTKGGIVLPTHRVREHLLRHTRQFKQNFRRLYAPEDSDNINNSKNISDNPASSHTSTENTMKQDTSEGHKTDKIIFNEAANNSNMNYLQRVNHRRERMLSNEVSPPLRYKKVEDDPQESVEESKPSTSSYFNKGMGYQSPSKFGNRDRSHSISKSVYHSSSPYYEDTEAAIPNLDKTMRASSKPESSHNHDKRACYAKDINDSVYEPRYHYKQSKHRFIPPSNEYNSSYHSPQVPRFKRGASMMKTYHQPPFSRY